MFHFNAQGAGKKFWINWMLSRFELGQKRNSRYSFQMNKTFHQCSYQYEKPRDGCVCTKAHTILMPSLKWCSQRYIRMLKKKKKSDEFSYGTQLLAFDPSQLRFGNTPVPRVPPAFIVFAWISILLFLSDNHRLSFPATNRPHVWALAAWPTLANPTLSSKGQLTDKIVNLRRFALEMRNGMHVKCVSLWSDFNRNCNAHADFSDTNRCQSYSVECYPSICNRTL